MSKKLFYFSFILIMFILIVCNLANLWRGQKEKRNHLENCIIDSVEDINKFIEDILQEKGTSDFAEARRQAKKLQSTLEEYMWVNEKVILDFLDRLLSCFQQTLVVIEHEGKNDDNSKKLESIHYYLNYFLNIDENCFDDKMWEFNELLRNDDEYLNLVY